MFHKSNNKLIKKNFFFGISLINIKVNFLENTYAYISLVSEMLNKNFLKFFNEIFQQLSRRRTIISSFPVNFQLWHRVKYFGILAIILLAII